MIFVAGATGFIGGSFLRTLKEAGRPGICLVRTPAHEGRCASMGFGTVRGDITNRDSLRGALAGADTVVHLVGIIEERGAQTFQKVHVEGTMNLIEESAAAGVRHFIYVSSLGANIGSPYPYARTKALAEEAVKSSGIPFTIFRPSLVIGPGGGFVGKLLDLINAPGPFLPVPGSGEVKFQPIYVGDLSRCLLSAVGNPSSLGKIYEIGGPEHLTYNDMLRVLAEAAHKRKKLLHIPMWVMMPAVKVLERVGLSPVTSDQLGLLGHDNVCDAGGIRKEFGFEPLSYRQAVELSISRRARGSQRNPPP